MSTFRCSNERIKFLKLKKSFHFICKLVIKSLNFACHVEKTLLILYLEMSFEVQIQPLFTCKVKIPIYLLTVRCIKILCGEVVGFAFLERKKEPAELLKENIQMHCNCQVQSVNFNCKLKKNLNLPGSGETKCMNFTLLTGKENKC